MNPAFPARRSSELAGEPVGSESVQDRPVEATHGRECRVGVERVPVAGQPVDQCLVGAGLERDRVIGVAIGGDVGATGGASVASPPALAADEGRHAHVEEGLAGVDELGGGVRSEEQTSELQSLMRISYAVFCLKKQTQKTNNNTK